MLVLCRTSNPGAGDLQDLMVGNRRLYQAVAELAARQWKALGVSLTTVAVLALASLGLFGLDFWRAFFVAAREAGSTAATELMFEQMHVQMVDGLSAVGASVDDHAIAVGQRFCARNLRCGKNQMSEQRRLIVAGVCERCDVQARDH